MFDGNIRGYNTTHYLIEWRQWYALVKNTILNTGKTTPKVFCCKNHKNLH